MSNTNEDIKFLEQIDDDEEKTKKCWINTYDERQRILNKEVKVDGYLKKFACLRTNSGYKYVRKFTFKNFNLLKIIRF